MLGDFRVKTVVAIEDDPHHSRILGLFLEQLGFEMLAATTAEEGMQLVRETMPAAIIVDLLLPEVDGWELIKDLKSDTMMAPIPVIVLSALSAGHAKQRAFDAGCDAYITKPIQMDDLREWLTKLT
jgi:DNA-binding response OmpR family regulator